MKATGGPGKDALPLEAAANSGPLSRVVGTRDVV